MRILSFFARQSVPILLVLVCFITMIRSDHWKTQSVIRGDAHGYSAYLAAWVIHGNFDFSFYSNLPKEKQDRYWLQSAEGSRPLPKFTMGVAHAQLPLFLVAHLVADSFGYEKDGWSAPYQLSIGLSALIFFAFGLFALFAWLKTHFSSLVASLTLLVLVLATNLFYYAAIDGAVSHVYSFSLLAIALYSFDRWMTRRRWMCLLLSAFLFGWVTLIRPTNVVFVLVPILLWLRSDEPWKFRIRGPKRIIGIIATGLMFLLPIVPQLLLWKLASGSFVFYSYTGEHFFWTSPYILEGLFSFRNGWLLYTPVMTLAILGLFFTARINKTLSLVIGLVLFIQVYVVFSWWCWYYGSSLSIRPMIDMYPLLAFSLAGFIRWTLDKGLMSWSALLMVMVFTVTNNMIQTHQYSEGQLSGSDMTKKAFNTLFLNPSPPHNMAFAGMFSRPDTEHLLAGIPERNQRDTIVEKSWNFQSMSIVMSSQCAFSSPLKVSASEFETPYDRTMHIQCEVKSENFQASECFLVVSFQDGDQNYGYYTVELKRLDLKAQKWNRVDAYIQKPKDLPNTGLIESYLWFQSGKGKIAARDLIIEQLDCPYLP